MTKQDRERIKKQAEANRQAKIQTVNGPIKGAVDPETGVALPARVKPAKVKKAIEEKGPEQ